jgi:hypothetical protein
MLKLKNKPPLKPNKSENGLLQKRSDNANKLLIRHELSHHGTQPILPLGLVVVAVQAAVGVVPVAVGAAPVILAVVAAAPVVAVAAPVILAVVAAVLVVAAAPVVAVASSFGVITVDLVAVVDPPLEEVNLFGKIFCYFSALH